MTSESVKGEQSNMWTPMHIAAFANDLDKIKLLVDNGIDIHVTNNNGIKPVHYAAFRGNVEIVEFFLNKGISVSDTSTTYMPIMHCGIASNKIEMVRFLIAQGADVNQEDAEEYTPMHIAARTGCGKGIIEELLKNNAIYDNVTEDNKTPADLATDPDVVKMLSLITELFMRVKCNVPEEVEKTIRDGAFVNATNHYNATPLQLAASRGYDEIVEILLRNAANPNALGAERNTPLHYAARFSHEKTVKSLLSHGALYDALTDAGETPLSVTTDNNIISLFQLISESFKKVSECNIQVIDDINKITDIDTLKAVAGARNSDHHTLVDFAVHCNFSEIEQLKLILQRNELAQVKAMSVISSGGDDNIVLPSDGESTFDSGVLNDVSTPNDERTSENPPTTDDLLLNKVKINVKNDLFIKDSAISSGGDDNIVLASDGGEDNDEVTTSECYESTFDNGVLNDVSIPNNERTGENPPTTDDLLLNKVKINVKNDLFNKDSAISSGGDNNIVLASDGGEDCNEVTTSECCGNRFDDGFLYDISTLSDERTVENRPTNQALLLIKVANSFKNDLFNKDSAISSGVDNNIVLTSDGGEDCNEVTTSECCGNRFDDGFLYDISTLSDERTVENSPTNEALLLNKVAISVKNDLFNKDSAISSGVYNNIVLTSDGGEGCNEVTTSECCESTFDSGVINDVSVPNDERTVENPPTTEAILLNKVANSFKSDLEFKDSAISSGGDDNILAASDGGEDCTEVMASKWCTFDNGILNADKNSPNYDAFVLNNVANKIVYRLLSKDSNISKVTALKKLENIAVIFMSMEYFEISLEVLKFVLDYKKNVLISNDISIFGTKIIIGNVLLGAQRFLEALEIFKEIIDDNSNNHSLNLTDPVIREVLNKINVVDSYLKESAQIEESEMRSKIVAAASCGDAEAVRLLLEDGTDVDEKDPEGETPLYYAANNGHVDVVKILLNNGADIYQVIGEKSLNVAAVNNHAEIVQILLQHKRSITHAGDINSKIAASQGLPVHVAAVSGFLDVIKHSLKLDDVHQKKEVSNWHKMTEEIFTDVKKGNIEVIDKLISLKPHDLCTMLNTRNEQGNTLLQILSGKKHTDVIDELWKMLRELDPAQSEQISEHESKHPTIYNESAIQLV